MSLKYNTNQKYSRRVR